MRPPRARPRLEGTAPSVPKPPAPTARCSPSDGYLRLVEPTLRTRCGCRVAAGRSRNRSPAGRDRWGGRRAASAYSSRRLSLESVRVTTKPALRSTARCLPVRLCSRPVVLASSATDFSPPRMRLRRMRKRVGSAISGRIWSGSKVRGATGGKGWRSGEGAGASGDIVASLGFSPGAIKRRELRAEDRGRSRRTCSQRKRPRTAANIGIWIPEPPCASGDIGIWIPQPPCAPDDIGIWIPELPCAPDDIGIWIPELPCAPGDIGIWISELPCAALISESGFPNYPAHAGDIGIWIPEPPCAAGDIGIWIPEQPCAPGDIGIWIPESACSTPPFRPRPAANSG